MTVVELKRLYQEWRTRLQRVQQIIQPPQWSVAEWNHFAKALFVLVKKYGSTWSDRSIDYWDVRWTLKDGGELVCQIEEDSSTGRRALVVAQTGGFASGVENYTWLYVEFDESGQFTGNPYWVDGNWKDALAMILLPHQMAAGFYLTGSSIPAHSLLLGGGTDSAPASAAAHEIRADVIAN